MSLQSMLTLALGWDLLVLAVLGARWLYSRSQRRTERVVHDQIRVMPTQDVPAVTGWSPTIIKGEVADCANHSEPDWMTK